MIAGDYNLLLQQPETIKMFLKQSLDNRKLDLITLHHSL